VPDPYGERGSYASHFIAEFTDALARMGVRMREVRQSERYPRGEYNAAIRHAMDLGARSSTFSRGSRPKVGTTSRSRSAGPSTTPAEWDAFVLGAKDGEFDQPWSPG
jgi:hypothetical protein